MSKPLLVLGTTDYVEVFIDMFEAVQTHTFAGCVENLDQSRCDQQIEDQPVYWSDDIDGMSTTHDLICALATTKRKAWIEDLAARGFNFATLVHPTSTVSQKTTLGAGASVDAGGVVAGYSTIGSHVRVGRRVAIGHHTTIGAYSTIHPGAIISGRCTIGEQVIIGTGAVIIDGMTIGDGAVISAGSLVTRKVPPGALFAGHPGVVRKPDFGPK